MLNKSLNYSYFIYVEYIIPLHKVTKSTTCIEDRFFACAFRSTKTKYSLRVFFNFHFVEWRSSQVHLGSCKFVKNASAVMYNRYHKTSDIINSSYRWLNSTIYIYHSISQMHVFFRVVTVERNLKPVCGTEWNILWCL